MSILIWFNHNVTGNLLANAIWGIPSMALGYWRIRHHQKAHHEQVHNHITQEFAKLSDEGNN